MSLQLLSFDLDDTLWPCWPAIRQAEKQSWRFIQRYFPQITDRYSIKQMQQQREQLKHKFPQLAHDISAIRRLHLRQLAQKFKLNKTQARWFEQQVFDVYYAYRNRVTLYDDVIPVLGKLKKVFTLVALSNGNANIYCMNNELKHLFDYNWSAAQAGAQKPDSQMFVDILRYFDLPASQACHIGDDPVHDVQGAKQAGIATVWIIREGQQHTVLPDSVKADYRIENLYQLLTLPVIRRN